MLKKTWIQAFITWLPAIICMAVIFMASSTPANRIENFGAWDTLVKKGGHFLGYAILGVTYVIGLGERRGKAWAIGFILAVLYAVSDEYHQLFVQGRHSSPIDVGIDSLGAAFGIFLLLRFQLKNVFNKRLSS